MHGPFSWKVPKGQLVIGGIYNIYNVEFSRKIKKLLKIDKNFFDTLNLTYIIPNRMLQVCKRFNQNEKNSFELSAVDIFL